MALTTDARTMNRRGELLDRLLSTLLTVAEATGPEIPRHRRSILARRIAGDVTGAWLLLASEALGGKETFRSVVAARARLAESGIAEDADPAMRQLLDVAANAIKNASLHGESETLVSDARSRWLFLLVVYQMAGTAALLAARFGDVAIEIRAQELFDDVEALIAVAEADLETEKVAPLRPANDLETVA